MISIFQQIILGIIQGIFEWLPFSSEGILLLVNSNFFNNPVFGADFMKMALFLHLGTFFAALIYFRKDVWYLLKNLFNYRNADLESKKVLNFLILSTFVTGIVGLAIFGFLTLAKINEMPKTSTIITLAVGLFLLITAFFQIKAYSKGHRREINLNKEDGFIVGFFQGLAVLPGVSRSGMTISTLLLRNIDETSALRLSYIMSLPVVLCANLVFVIPDLALVSGMFVGVIFAFIFGILTINFFMALSKKVKFGYFVLVFAILMLLASSFSIIKAFF